MSIIAVGGIRIRRSLNRIVKLLAPVINGPFEALNFTPGNKGTKICYIRLSPDLDPLKVIKRINATQTPTFNPYAYIPKHVPDLKIASKLRTYPAEPGPGIRVPVLTPKQLISHTHGRIMTELQFKYTGLYDLNKENEAKGHPKLIYKIGEVVYKRLVEIKKTRKMNTVFQLSKTYRKKHPHFADFQMILSILHQLQDAEGKPRAQLEESELTIIRIMPTSDMDEKFERFKAIRDKYLNKITNNVLEHVKNLPTEVNPEKNSLAEAARIKVREQMNKLTPYLPGIINHVFIEDFSPDKSDYRKVCIYGEPYLPSRELLRPWLKRHNAHTLGATRDLCMYNLLSVRVLPDALVNLLEADGAVVGDSTLVIRPSDVPVLTINVDEYSEVKAETSSKKPETLEVKPNVEPQWSQQW